MSVARKNYPKTMDSIKLVRDYNSDSLSRLIPQVMHMPPEFFVQWEELCKNPPPTNEYLKKALLEYWSSSK